VSVGHQKTADQNGRGGGSVDVLDVRRRIAEQAALPLCRDLLIEPLSRPLSLPAFVISERL